MYTLLRDYPLLKTIQVTETLKFNQCKQTEREPVSVFRARLSRLASSCDFGVNLQRRLRDQLVSGIRSAETRKKLLQKDQDYNYALAIALADEAACREACQLNSSSSSGDIHHIKHKHSTYPSKCITLSSKTLQLLPIFLLNRTNVSHVEAMHIVVINASSGVLPDVDVQRRDIYRVCAGNVKCIK